MYRKRLLSKALKNLCHSGRNVAQHSTCHVGKENVSLGIVNNYETNFSVVSIFKSLPRDIQPK